MVAAGVTFVLYFVTITILPQNEQNLTQILGSITKHLDEDAANITVIHKFKVTGESKIIAVVNASNNMELDSFMHQLHSVASLAIACQPIIPFEKFARNLGVSEKLTEPSTIELQRNETLYWFTLYVDYFGNKTSELLQIWKATAERSLASIKSGTIRAILYKNLAERQVHLFWHVSDIERLDIDSFKCPLVVNFGSNVHFESKGINFMDQYKVRD